MNTTVIMQNESKDQNIQIYQPVQQKQLRFQSEQVIQGKLNVKYRYPINYLKKKNAEDDEQDLVEFWYQKFEQVKLDQRKLAQGMTKMGQNDIELAIRYRSLKKKEFKILQIIAADMLGLDINIQRQEIRDPVYIDGLPIVIPHFIQHLSFPQSNKYFLLGLKLKTEEDPYQVIDRLQKSIDNKSQQLLSQQLSILLKANVVIHNQQFPDTNSSSVSQWQGSSQIYHFIQWGQNYLPDLVRVYSAVNKRLLQNWYFEQSKPPQDSSIISTQYDEDMMIKVKKTIWMRQNGEEERDLAEDKFKQVQIQPGISQQVIENNQLKIVKIIWQNQMEQVYIQYSNGQQQIVRISDLQTYCETLNHQQMQKMVTLIPKAAIFKCDTCAQMNNNKMMNINALFQHWKSSQGKHNSKVLKQLQEKKFKKYRKQSVSGCSSQMGSSNRSASFFSKSGQSSISPRQQQQYHYLQHQQDKGLQQQKPWSLSTFYSRDQSYQGGQKNKDRLYSHMKSPSQAGYQLPAQGQSQQDKLGQVS